MKAHSEPASAALQEILDALVKGCPICHLVSRHTTRWIDTLLYERVNDPGTRDQLRESLGFCNRHAWLVRSAGDVVGQTIIYEDLMKTVRILLEAGRQPVSGKDCALCAEEAETERQGVKEFIAHFRDDALQVRYRGSPGLCLPHLACILEETDDAMLRADLLRAEQNKVTELVQDLGELKQRQDWRSNQKSGKERDAWDRAIAKLCGLPGIQPRHGSGKAGRGRFRLPPKKA
ncbi:MAG: DUF6062 family protein [candidate division WOR-3 bacterium]